MDFLMELNLRNFIKFIFLVSISTFFYLSHLLASLLMDQHYSASVRPLKSFPVFLFTLKLCLFLIMSTLLFLWQIVCCLIFVMGNILLRILFTGILFKV